MRNFLIYAHPFTRKWGGVISIHQLCHLINQVGGTAFLHPDNVELIEVNALNIVEAVKFAQNQVFNYANFSVEQFLGDSKFNTPVTHIFNDREYGEDWIVVYPEITFGNPLRAKNVVRWLLHNPGFHSGRINYGPNEFHVRFHSSFDPFHYPGSTLSENYLTLMDFDFDTYNTDGAAIDRSGSAYCIKKGAGKLIQHDLTDSILIDHLSQEEIARVFKSVKTFYSYDTKTAYSQLAVLCGCESVVIPDVGKSEAEWMADDDEIVYGVAYGLENLEKASQTSHLLKPVLQRIKDRGADSVMAFMKEADAFFG